MFRRSWFVLPFFLIGCNDSPPGPPPPPPRLSTIQITADDIGVTEAWLKVTLTDSNQPRTIALRRDGQIISNVQFTGTDTVLVDVGLAPNHLYRYTSLRMQDSTIVDTASVQLTTMDTTSHNFIWQIDTLGESSSVLFDVAIVNDTLAYAVGDINLRDTSGSLEPPYGLVVVSPFDRRLVHLYANNPLGTSILRPKGIHAFSPTDVWLANGAVFHWDGDTVTPYWINAFPGNPNPILDPGQGAEKVCGTSSSDLFVVGVQGAIASFDGQQWRRMDAGTSVDLLTCWTTGQSFVWACGYRSSYSESILLRYNGSAWEEYGHSPPWGVYADLFGSVWCYKNDSAYVVGNLGVFRHAQSSATGFRRIPLELGYFPYKIRGAARNDIVIVGDQGMIWHFNGLTWKRFDRLINSLDRLHSVAIAYDQIIAVGYRYYNGVENYAVIYHGRR